MTWDPLWDEVFQNQSWGKYPGEELIRFVARNYYGVPDRSSVRLLEVGCGPGANLWFCAREGFTIHGVEGAHSAVVQARQRLDSECPGWKGSVDEGDFAHLRYPEGHFDGVMDNEAVCHNDFASSCRAYQEIARVLKPGGKLFIRTFATGTTGDRTGEPMGRNAWRVSEGPMLGKGLSRFTDEGDFSELFGPELAIQSCDLLTWTLANRAQIVREWILVLQKHV